jgi:chemotaxis protein methyltransferase CheR
MSTPQEYLLSDRAFDRIRDLIRDRAGIALSEAKRELVYGRLARRLRELKLESFEAYLSLLEGDESREIEEFTNALTTNLTSFFREGHHFEYLTQHVFPFLERRNARTRRLRLWSAACSTGEEPYSLAMTLAESLGRFRGWDVRILATDLDSEVLKHAQAGRYRSDRLSSVPVARRDKWFAPQGPNHHLVKDQIRELITFRQLNLMHDWPFRGPFDVILCRNVVIYFDKETQRRLFGRIAQMQIEGSYLFIGHSESLFKVTDLYDSLGKTMYRRTATSEAAPS